MTASASQLQTRPSPRGFTLIEIVVVVVVISILAGSAFLALRMPSGEERDLRRARAELSALVRKGKRLARMTGNSQRLEFREEGVALTGAVRSAAGKERGEPDGLSLRWPEGVVGVELRRGMAPEPIAAEGQVWTIPARGLAGSLVCELEHESGGRIAVLFHPLTLLPTRNREVQP